MKGNWPAALATGPALMGLALSALLSHDVLPNWILVGTYQMDLAALAVGAGVLLSITGWGILGLRKWIGRQVVEARAAEREAHAAAYQRFLRRLDHELKNSLAIMRLGVANLQNRMALSSGEEDSLTCLGEQVRRLEGLTTGLRWLAELDELELEGESVDLQAVLEEALAKVSGPDVWPGRGGRGCVPILSGEVR